MREIKFRIWDQLENKLLTDFHFGDWCNANATLNGVLNNDAFARFIFEQFTGLLDKNGKEIYEGDLIKGYDGNILVVFFYSGGFVGKTLESKNNSPLTKRLFTSKGKLEYEEIVGNIHEKKI